MPQTIKPRKILAVSSGGGHWIQMLRLRPAFDGCDVTFVTTDKAMRRRVTGHSFFTVCDGNRDTKLSLLFMAIKILWVMSLVRPHVVVTTGAAPGYFACRFARFFGAKSLFIDSVANAEDMSLSAKLATSHASKVVSQWPSVADKYGISCMGNVF